MNRRLAKYINNKKKYIKTEINKEPQIKVSKAKDIVITKLPRIRNLGYQSIEQLENFSAMEVMTVIDF